MPENIDDYIDAIKKKYEGSALLASLCGPTLKNSEYVHVFKPGMNGVACVMIPETHYAIVHTASGNSRKKDSSNAASLVERLVAQAERINAEPIAFVNVIDTRVADNTIIQGIGNNLVERANLYKLAIVNGELGILGSIIENTHVSGTMLSIIRKDVELPVDTVPKEFMKDGTKYFIFDPKAKAIYMNADDVGTKTEIYVRKRRAEHSFRDLAAMNLDDAVKLGATVHVLAASLVYKGKIPTNRMRGYLGMLGELIGIYTIIHIEHTNDTEMLHAYREEAPAFILSGAAVSTIDKKWLLNFPKPEAGNYIVAVRRKKNSRSNGYTDKRKAMELMLGNDWHKSKEGERFLNYLARPSTILYRAFKTLLEQGAATSVYHLSGGSFDGKLAKPLAEHDLFARIENIFKPHEYDIKLAQILQAKPEDVYAKWTMGNEGFITTDNVWGNRGAIEILNAYGLTARVVGQLENAANGRTGIELEGIKDSNGKNVYFSGKD